jgi:Rod binding domain-containing protein
VPDSMSAILPSNRQDDLSSAQGSAAIKTLRGAQAPGADPRKIEKAARSFESLLVGHWLEQAEKSFVAVPGVDQDEQNDSSRSQFLSIACESLAQGLSKAGGFGIANMITKRLEAATKADSTRETHPASVAVPHPTGGHKLSGVK